MRIWTICSVRSFCAKILLPPIQIVVCFLIGSLCVIKRNCCFAGSLISFWAWNPLRNVGKIRFDLYNDLMPSQMMHKHLSKFINRITVRAWNDPPCTSVWWSKEWIWWNSYWKGGCSQNFSDFCSIIGWLRQNLRGMVWEKEELPWDKKAKARTRILWSPRTPGM